MAMKIEKFDLHNVRYDPARPSIVVEEIENIKPVPSTLRVGKQANNILNIPFRNAEERELPTKPSFNSTAKTAVVDNRGHYFDMNKKLENENLTCFEKMPPRQGLYNTYVKRYELQSMNRLLDRIHEVDTDTITERLRSDKVKGIRISNYPPDRMVDPTNLEKDTPTDIILPTRSIVHEHNFLKFSELETSYFDTQKESPRTRRLRSMMKNRCGTAPADEFLLTKNTVEKDIEKDSPTLYPPAPNTAAKFGIGNRWKDKIYKMEKHHKWSGLLLGHDYDKKWDTRMSTTLSPHAKRDLNLAKPVIYINDVEPDSLKKISTFTKVKKHPMKYTVAFKSKAKKGTVVPVTATGGLGPGAYPHKTSVQIYWPDRESRSFRSDRHWYYEDYKAPHDPEEPYTYKGDDGLSFHFSKADARGGGRNEHLRHVAKSKTTKVYPKFAAKRYNSFRLSRSTGYLPLDEFGSTDDEIPKIWNEFL